MKIEINYNGSLATCKVDDKPFNECNINKQVFAINAFKTIIKDWKRQPKQEYNTIYKDIAIIDKDGNIVETKIEQKKN